MSVVGLDVAQNSEPAQRAGGGSPIYLGPPTWAGDTGGTVGETSFGGPVALNQPSLGSSFPGVPYTGFIVPGGLGAFQSPSGPASGGSNLLPLLLVGGGVVAFLWWRTHG